MDTTWVIPRKVVAALLFCLGLQRLAFAQSGIPFGATLTGAEAVPPSTFGLSGCGRLWLQGTNLVYRFAAVGFSQDPIELHGPAALGINGPLLHVLGFSRRELSDDYCRTAEGFPPPEPGGKPRPMAAVIEGVVPMTPEHISDLKAGLLYATYVVRPLSPPRPGVPPLELQTRGQITLLDSDSDGVPDFQDQCPNTPLGAIINSHGCSIDQLCPCEGPWRNHGEFINSMRNVLNEFSAEGLISAQQHRELLRAATTSDCGKPQH